MSKMLARHAVLVLSSFLHMHVLTPQYQDRE